MKNILKPILKTIINPRNLLSILDSSLQLHLQSFGSHYKKDDLIIYDGSDFISQWNDLSGNEKHAVQAIQTNKAQYINNALNNLPAIKFDGIDDYFLTNALVINPALTDFSLFIVANFIEAGSGGPNVLLSQNDAVNGKNYIRNPLARIQCNIGGGTTLNADVNFGTEIYGLTNSAGLLSLYVDGVFAASENRTINNTNGELVIGTNESLSGGFMDGYIGEIILYNRLLSTNEISILHNNYLKKKWKIN